MNKHYVFPGVTLLITHYNRSHSLERLLSSLRDLDCHFDEIVVSDDASRPEHLDAVKAMQSVFNFRLITTPVNKGHGHSMNKGQDVITTPYTIYVQEDFVPSATFPVHFADALQFMNEDKSIDYIRFWAAVKYPDLKPYGKGYSQMIFRYLTMNHLKFYQYSDTPHLRRKTFFDKFGRYKEGINGYLIDFKMAISFLHHKGKGLFYEECLAVFSHENSAEEPSTMLPLLNWRHRRNTFTLFVRFFYLRFKIIKDTWLMKFMKS